MRLLRGHSRGFDYFQLFNPLQSKLYTKREKGAETPLKPFLLAFVPFFSFLYIIFPFFIQILTQKIFSFLVTQIFFFFLFQGKILARAQEIYRNCQKGKIFFPKKRKIFLSKNLNEKGKNYIQEREKRHKCQ